MAQSATTDTFAATLTEGPCLQGFGEPTLTRDFAAPRELVFRAFIEPEQFVRFWAPAGSAVPLSSVTIEPWAGGRLEYTTVTDTGVGHPTMCTFLAVEEPETLTYADHISGVDVSMVLSDLGDGRTRASLFHRVSRTVPRL